ncbi:ATP-binding protein [Xanthobacteraceae bacterium A53D]
MTAFPSGGGAMGAAIRAFDWTATPLGARETWPATLRASVELALSSSGAMSSGAIWLAWGPDLTLLYADAFVPMLGSKHPAALGSPLSQVWAEIWDEVGPLVRRTLDGEPVMLENVPLRIKRSDEFEEAWFTFSYMPLHGEDGRVQGLYCVVYETTARFLADQRRDVAEAGLRAHNVSLQGEVEDRTHDLERVWDVTRDLLLIADADGIWRNVNPALLACLGWREDELLGRTSEWIEHPDDRHKTRAEIVDLAGGGTTMAFENRMRTTAGDYRSLAWTAVLADGKIYAAARDVTDAHAQAEALKRAEDALRQAQKMEAVGQLTGGLAHDFNNLLAGISGSLELIQTRLQQGRFGEVERFITAAQGAARRAATLTHRLLAFSRRQTLDPRPTNVDHLAAGLQDMIQRTVGPSIRVEMMPAVEPWPVLVDASQLENALLNLCINARDAMPEGGRITVATENRVLDAQVARERGLTRGDYLVLSVADTGTGMSADVISHAFEPFFTTKPIGEGTGLGLSMIYGFARQSGGQVRIVSQEGQGTTVCLYLPRHFGPAEEEAAPVRAARLPRSNGGETVLVVDDEPTVRMLVTDVLEDLGYTAIEAGDSAAGLKVLQSDVRIDLLVSDVGLPGGMNGRQMVDAALVSRPNLKVLFITGYADGANLGGTGLPPNMAVQTKPFQVEALAARIRALIEAK